VISKSIKKIEETINQDNSEADELLMTTLSCFYQNNLACGVKLKLIDKN